MSEVKNVVIFGPTNSGKTTLLGYMKAKNMSPALYEKYIMNFKSNLGRNFSEDSQLSYFFDTAPDEIRDKSQKSVSRKNAPGNSMRKKFQTIKIGETEITVIDTPGTTNRWKHGYQGILMGDVGVFVIEIRTVLEVCDLPRESPVLKKKIHELFDPVELWLQQKRGSQLLIVLSKIDDWKISAFDINRAKDYLQELKGLEKTPIIPTGINVPKCSGINILTTDDKKVGMPVEKSFIKALSELIKKPVPFNKNVSGYSVASIDRIFKQTKLLKAPAIRIKVNSGLFCENDTVSIAPVLYQNRVVSVTGNIRSLMDEGSHDLTQAFFTNDIGGIVFSKLQCQKDTITLKDITLLSTSVLWKDPLDYKFGNILTFNIPDTGYAKDLSIRQDINLIYFGKTVYLRIISCAYKNKYYQIRVMNTQPNNPISFAVPKRTNGEFCYKSYVLQYQEHFLSGELQDVDLLTDDTPKEIVLSLKNNYLNNTYLTELGVKMIYVESLNQTIIDSPPLGRKKFVDLLSTQYIKIADYIEVKAKSDYSASSNQ